VTARSDERYAAVVATPIGAFGIRLGGEAVTGIDLIPGALPAAGRSAAARRAADAVRAYFDDPRRPVDVPLDLRGTRYRRGVWEAMRAIPPGEVRTYGDLARAAGGSPRAVGGACGANPVPLLVPCHRVVGASGPGGFSMGGERGPALKRWLLAHEGVSL